MRRVPDLIGRRHRVAATLADHYNLGEQAVERLRQQLADLDAQIDSRRPHAGQLLIVDEASLAGTLALDELVAAANNAGAKVLLVGDSAQLSAVEAGGAFSLVTSDQGDLVAHLDEVRRFNHDWEKVASLDLRLGRPEAIDAYQTHGRIISGDRDQLLEAIYQAWRTDIHTGQSSLMIAADTATVADLNRRARADRVAVGEVSADAVDIAAGQTAGIGDQVVTRQNDRRITTRGGWVKNGDRWTVTAIHADRSLTLQRSNRNGEVRIPADYAADHLELAYAATAYQAQGRTVDTAHAVITPTTTRQVLYVSATRGRDSNHLYVDTCFDPDPETGHDCTARTKTANLVITEVLANTGSEQSAHEVIRQASRQARLASTTVPTTTRWTDPKPAQPRGTPGL